MEAALFGIFGLIVGSFLNVLILRHGVRSLGGRSACPHCERTLRWYELIPVFSYIALRARCRSCKARISPQYVIVELLTGALFLMIGAAPIELIARLIALAIAALLLAIAVYDLYHTIIPDRWVYSAGGLAILALFLTPVPIPTLLWFIAAGPLAALPLFALWALSRGRWMGFGDVKLALVMGWLLGVSDGVQAVFLAFVIGALVSVCVLLPLPSIIARLRTWGIARSDGGKSYTMKSEVPFGPFLIASCFLVWLTQMYGIEIPLILPLGGLPL